jgi:hypothetical protein
LQTADELIPAAQEAIFCPQHQVPVDLELLTDDKIPLVFECLIQ